MENMNIDEMTFEQLKEKYTTITGEHNAKLWSEPNLREYMKKMSSDRQDNKKCLLCAKQENIYKMQYNYEQVKAICEIFKYREQLEVKWGETVDYEDIVALALQYYNEWEQLADLKNCKRTKPVLNEIGNEVEFVNKAEFAYSQLYIDRRVCEEYIW